MSRPVIASNTKIVLNKLNIRNHFSICSKNPFFSENENYILKMHDDRIEITRPTLDYQGRTIKAVSCDSAGKRWVILRITPGYDYPIGDFEPDQEESNEDKLVFNFN